MNYYWMMGDNRHNSADSRFWGFVPEDHMGKGVVRMAVAAMRKSFPANIRSCARRRDPRTTRRAAQTVLRRHAPLLRLAAARTPRRGVPHNDDGEPSGNGRKTDPRTTALERHHGLPGGRGRYFGGTKLGVSGLIAAYRESAAGPSQRRIVERTVDRTVRVDFPLCGDERHHAGRWRVGSRASRSRPRQPLYDAARDPAVLRSGGLSKNCKAGGSVRDEAGMKYEQRIEYGGSAPFLTEKIRAIVRNGKRETEESAPGAGL